MSRSASPRDPSASLSVLLASSERDYYGGEAQALLLARGLRRRGHRVVVLARRGGALHSRAARDGLDALAWDPGHGPGRLLATRRILRRLGVDVLHCNDSRALTAAASAAVGLGVRARIAARRVAFPLRSPLAYRLLADALVCVSEDVRRTCADAGLAESLLHVVHDGIDVGGLRAGSRDRGRAALGIPHGARAVLTVASLNECKGHAILLDALEPMLGANHDLHLVLAGGGPLRERIAARATRAVAADRIHMLGYRDDVPDLLHAADLFVLPSLQEGLGTALLEAMCTGLPCIASNLGGTVEALDGGAGEPPCGWLVPAGDPGALADAVRTVLADPVEAMTRGQRARERVRERFTAERMVEGTLAVYRRVLGRM